MADVVQANLLAMQATKAGGEAVNFAGGLSIGLNDLVAVISSVFGRELPIECPAFGREPALPGRYRPGPAAAGQ